MADYSYTPLFLTKDRIPWFPVMGEMHYSRYPKAYWKESLYKMKAGGVDIVSCYAFWIHHEECENQFDFSGDRDLRAFLETAKNCGLKVLLRIGPWAHGEARNGGFPDWLLQKQIPLRCNDLKYLAYVKRYYGQLAAQAKGLLEKDGGPIIGVQIENEYGHVGGSANDNSEQHMRTLHSLALEVGFDVPLFTATGWGCAAIGDMLPVMGGYCDAPWDQRLTEIEPSGNFIFTPERNDSNIGSDLEFGHGITFDLTKFPFLTAELGGGLQVTHHRRPIARGTDAAAMSLVKMGSGCSLLGYYMYHGGTNPDGVLSTLQESRATGYPNDLPVKSYDFNAPIREFGQLSDGWREIRMLSLFLHDFGSSFCQMLPHFPEDNPTHPADQTHLRYALRHDGHSGYLFVNNYQRRHEMAAHRQVSLSAVLDAETISFPPFDVKDGEYFFFPFNLPLKNGTVLKSALATPLCCLNGDTWVFYGDRDPQFCTEGDLTGITLLSLSRADALNASKVTLDRDYLMICDADLIPMEDGIHIQGTKETVCLRTFPPLPAAPAGFQASLEDGFGVYRRTLSDLLRPAQAPVSVGIEEIVRGTDITEKVVDSRMAGIAGCANGINESAAGSSSRTVGSAVSESNVPFRIIDEIPSDYPRDGVVYRLSVPRIAGLAGGQTLSQKSAGQMPQEPAAIGQPRLIDLFLEFDAICDRMEIYQDQALISDAFYTGQKIMLGLKRFAYPNELLIKVFAYHDDIPLYLEEYPEVENHTACSLKTIRIIPQWEIVISGI